jgi:hypothetical protein
VQRSIGHTRSGSLCLVLGIVVAVASTMMVTGASDAAPVAERGGQPETYTIYNGPWNVRNCSSTICLKVGTIRNGPILELLCQTYGQMVTIGPQQTPVWNRVRLNNGRTGYVTNMAIRETTLWFDADLPRCTGGGGGSVYFMPRDYTIWNRDPKPPGIVTELGDWSNGNCGPGSATSFPSMVDDTRVTTLSGWSRGRLGPTYAMASLPVEQVRAINYVILFDPGSYEEYFGSGSDDELPSCDLQYDQNALYRDWLAQRSSNRLLILAGEVTRDAPTASGNVAHRGIQEALFRDIRGTRLASQVLVCNYNRLDHQGVLRKFKHIVAEPRRSSCPRAANDTFSRGWSP